MTPRIVAVLIFALAAWGDVLLYVALRTSQERETELIEGLHHGSAK